MLPDILPCTEQPTAENYLAPNVSSAKGEKPWVKGTYMQLQATQQQEKTSHLNVFLTNANMSLIDDASLTEVMKWGLCVFNFLSEECQILKAAYVR